MLNLLVGKTYPTKMDPLKFQAEALICGSRNVLRTSWDRKEKGARNSLVLVTWKITQWFPSTCLLPEKIPLFTDYLAWFIWYSQRTDLKRSASWESYGEFTAKGICTHVMRTLTAQLSGHPKQYSCAAVEKQISPSLFDEWAQTCL